jgi:hypothetical protein
MTIILIAWLQLVLTVPIDGIIGYVFDHYILAPTHLAIQEQQKLLYDAMNSNTTSSATNSINKVTPINSNIISTFTSIVTSVRSNQVMPIDTQHANSDIKSTILVTKEFVSRRYKMIVDFLSDHHKDTTNTAMDISRMDDTEIMFKFYQGTTITSPHTTTMILYHYCCSYHFYYHYYRVQASLS